MNGKAGMGRREREWERRNNGSAQRREGMEADVAESH